MLHCVSHKVLKFGNHILGNFSVFQLVDKINVNFTVFLQEPFLQSIAASLAGVSTLMCFLVRISGSVDVFPEPWLSWHVHLFLDDSRNFLFNFILILWFHIFQNIEFLLSNIKFETSLNNSSCLPVDINMCLGLFLVISQVKYTHQCWYHNRKKNGAPHDEQDCACLAEFGSWWDVSIAYSWQSYSGEVNGSE